MYFKIYKGSKRVDPKLLTEVTSWGMGLKVGEIL